MCGDPRVIVPLRWRSSEPLAPLFARRSGQEDRPVPNVYYFTGSLEEAHEKRAAMHAKCVVVDDKDVFVSSANFTEAAHQRNIEVGLLIRSPTIATQLTQHFRSLRAAGLLRPVFNE